MFIYYIAIPPPLSCTHVHMYSTLWLTFLSSMDAVETWILSKITYIRIRCYHFRISGTITYSTMAPFVSAEGNGFELWFHTDGSVQQTGWKARFRRFNGYHTHTFPPEHPFLVPYFLEKEGQEVTGSVLFTSWLFCPLFSDWHESSLPACWLHGWGSSACGHVTGVPELCWCHALLLHVHCCGRSLVGYEEGCQVPAHLVAVYWLVAANCENFEFWILKFFSWDCGREWWEFMGL